MVFLLRDKDLFHTGRHRHTFKYETGVDNLTFIIPKEYNGIDLASVNCVVEVELPTIDPDQHFQYAIVKYDETPYREDYLSVTVPITTAITKFVGEVKVWLMFIDATDETMDFAKVVLKSNSDSFMIEDNGSSDSGSETTFDEIWKHVSLDALVDTVNNLITYDRTEENDGGVEFDHSDEEEDLDGEEAEEDGIPNI